MSTIEAEQRVGSPQWLVAAEQIFGGLVSGVRRNVVSPLDPRSREAIARGGMTGGDRMHHHGYGPVYSRFLEPFVANRLEKFTIVEAGILKGTGLALWSALFPNADIVGLDIDLEHCRANLPELKARGAFLRAEPELHLFDQFKDGEPEIVDVLAGRKVDIMIDDGFHSLETIMNTARAVKKSLAQRFVYFVEDNAHVQPALQHEFPDCLVVSAGQLTVIFR